MRTRTAAVVLALGASCSGSRQAHASTAEEQREGQSARPGVSVSVVTRDWEGGTAVIGQLIATDFLRPTRSSQMVFGRLRLSGGPLASFVQLGLGTWRLDVDLVPKHTGELDRAVQLGAGVAWSASADGKDDSGLSLALETDSTMLLRDRGAGASTCHRGPQVAGGMLVARIQF